MIPQGTCGNCDEEGPLVARMSLRLVPLTFPPDVQAASIERDVCQSCAEDAVEYVKELEENEGP